MVNVDTTNHRCLFLPIETTIGTVPVTLLCQKRPQQSGLLAEGSQWRSGIPAPVVCSSETVHFHPVHRARRIYIHCKKSFGALLDLSNELSWIRLNQHFRTWDIDHPSSHPLLIEYHHCQCRLELPHEQRNHEQTLKYSSFSWRIQTLLIEVMVVLRQLCKAGKMDTHHTIRSPNPARG